MVKTRCLLAAFVAVGSLGLVNQVRASASTSASSATASSALRTDRLASQGQDVCAQNVPAGVAHCNSVLGVPPAVLPNQVGVGVPAVSTLGDDGAYSPSYLQSAYDVASASRLGVAGAGEIVAIVDAFSNPTIATDLAYYRSFFKLSACPVGVLATTRTGCALQIVNETGTASPLPAPSASWGLEEAIDVDMVSAICPRCQILLVETSSASLGDLGAGVNVAVGLGASVVSNSYGSTEYPGEVNDSNEYFNHPGVAIVAASGDAGYGVEFPATSPDVVAVGGTSLVQNGDAGVRSGSSTVWSDSGAGCSAYEPKPTWQTDTGCAGRSDNDVAADADPSTGVWAYDTSGYTGLVVAGGTSVAAPIIGGLYALAGSSNLAPYPAQSLYENRDELTGVVVGSDGTCGTYLCNADQRQDNYNGPAGVGTPTALPNSASAFSATPDVNVPARPSPPTSLAGVPSVPLDVVASPGDAQAVITWSTPTSSGDAPISSYHVATNEGESCAEVVSSEATNSCTVDGLTNGRSYVFLADATNAAGVSAWSTGSVAVTPGGVPGAPLDVTAVSGNESAIVRWAPPLGDGGSPISSYHVTDSSGDTCSVTVSASALDSCAVSPLSNGVSYQFSVTATNAAGTSVSSALSAPVLIATNTPATSVSAGENFACALFRAGTVRCWGSNEYGQLGNGTFVSSATQVQVRGVTGATQISSGINSACAIVAHGAVECWGANTFAQLGDGSTVNAATPVRVRGLTGVRVLTSGFQFRCALLRAGTVECWGYNDNGQLGNGTYVTERTPTRVSALRGATAIVVDEDHACAIVAHGAVECWGANKYGQLGDRSLATSKVPVRVRALSAVRAIGVGFSNTCALLANRTVACWGYNGDGELGDATTTNSSVPTTVTALGDVAHLAVGNFNSCAQMTNGSVDCWGLNSSTELDDNATVTAAPSAPALNLAGELNLSLDSGYSCSLLKNRTVECWINGAAKVTVLWFPDRASPVTPNVTTSAPLVVQPSGAST